MGPRTNEETTADAERLLVCVSSSPSSEALVRTAKRLASDLRAEWTAAYVETPSALRLDAEERERLAHHLRLAQALGAETVTLAGESGPEEIARFARARNVTRILVGKPTHASWRDRLRGSFLERLVRESGEIDVHALTGDSLVPSRASHSRPLAGPSRGTRADTRLGLVLGVVSVGLATALAQLAFGAEQLPDVVMLYLFVIVLVSLRWGLGPSLVASLTAVAAFDYFFIPPYHTFEVSDVRHTVTFAVMLFVGVTISGLTKRVRDQARAAHERERRTAALLSLSRALGAARTEREVLSVATKQLEDVFRVRARASLDPSDVSAPPRGTAMPLMVEQRVLGVLTLERAPESDASHDTQQHLEAFVVQIANALERVRLAAQAEDAKVRVEREVLKNALLSSVSHDLRTPLAVITGAASTMLDGKIDPQTRRELTETVLGESERLNRLVRNLLDMTRLEAGAVVLHKEWQPVEEVVGVALERVSEQLGARAVEVDVPAELLAPFDSVLLQQVLVNLLENAARYTPTDAPVKVSARELPASGEVEIVVADRGPGLPAGDEDRVFEKFYRAEKGRGGGVGLGLTICRAIATAHGGRVWAESREGGGALFHVALPRDGEPPSLAPPEALEHAGATA